MSDLRSAADRARLLDNLYAAAETILQAVADPIVLDAAPLNHRVQALDAIGRFIDRLEKREAERRAGESAASGKPEVVFVEIVDDVGRIDDAEELDCYVALELATPGRYEHVEGVVERIAFLERNDPEALGRFDAELARHCLRKPSPGRFTRSVWPDGDPHAPPSDTAAPAVDRDHLRSQITQPSYLSAH